MATLRSDLEYLIGPHWRDEIAPSEATSEYLARLKDIAFTWSRGLYHEARGNGS